MRLGKTAEQIRLLRQAKLKAMKPRHKWFAWYPVTDSRTDQVLWLETVWCEFPILQQNNYSQDLYYHVNMGINYYMLETFNG